MNRFFLYDLWKCSNQKFHYKNQFFYEIFFDTRNIIQGQKGVYFCFEKTIDKAKNYINDAIEKKVVAIVTTFKVNITICPILIYKNPMQLLQKFATNHINKFKNLQKIVITGSSGKTIIKEWLYQCLNNNYSINFSPNNYNSQIGIPISALQIKKYHKFSIFECGISFPNEMKYIERMIKPQIGILTNINKQHLENFTSKKQLIKEKCLLFENVKTIFCYCNNYHMYNYLKIKFKKKKIIIIGVKKFCDIQLIKFTNSYIYIKIFSKVYFFKIKIANSKNIFNLLIIISILHYFGLSKDIIQKKILNLKYSISCLKTTNGIFNSMIIHDTYELNLLSIQIAIDKLNYIYNNKKILILIDSFLNKSTYFSIYKNIFNFLNFIVLDHIFIIGKFNKKHKTISINPISFISSIKKFIHEFNKININNSTILIKGNKTYKLKNFIKSIENNSHNTVLEINLNSLYHNIKFFRNLLNSTTKIMAVVKANSYGITNYEIPQFLQYYKIDYLCVAYSDEGVKLRKHGIYIPIMVMNTHFNAYDDIINYNLEPEFYSLKFFNLFIKKLKRIQIKKKKFPIHIKIDTGMHRLGFQKSQLSNLIKEIKNNIAFITIKSIFTHLSSTEDKKDYNFTLNQIYFFQKCYTIITTQLGYMPLKHILNTHGIINYLDYQFNMVRIGIGMYGCISNTEIQHKLKNVITLKTKISQIIYLKKGDTVGYNRMFIANKNIKIGTLPIGYADGIFRQLSNTKKFYVIINNQKIKVIGSICMDMMMINLKNINYDKEQDVIIYGNIESIKNIAKLCNTIPYEIFTSISSRIKRIFIEN